MFYNKKIYRINVIKTILISKIIIFYMIIKINNNKIMINNNGIKNNI